MEEKKITLRVSTALHRQAKIRMLDDLGEDNFQRLLHNYLDRYANRLVETAEIPVLQPGPIVNEAAHALIDELIEKRPETAENILATIRALVADQPIGARVAPPQPNKLGKNAKQA